MGWTLPNIVADLGGAVEAHAHPLVSDLGGVTHTPPHVDHDIRSGSATAPTASIYQRAKNWAQVAETVASFPEKMGWEKIKSYANAPVPDTAAKLLPQKYQPLAKEFAIPPELRVGPAIAKPLTNYLESEGYHKSANALRAYAGIEEGEADFVHSMESPTGLAMAYSGGKLLDMGVAGRVLDRLIAGGFSIQSLHDAYKNAPDVAKAVDSGDYEQAARAMTNYFGSAAFAGAMMAGAVEAKPKAAWETAPQEAWETTPQEETQPERPALPSGEDKEISLKPASPSEISLKPGQYRIVPDTPKADISASGPEWERQIVARKKGNVVGGVGYKVDRDGKAMVYGAVVSPDHRNQGIATNMYEHVIRDAKASGAKQVTSDSTGVSTAAKGVWNKLAAKGYPVQEITHPNGMSGFAIDLGQLDLKTAEPPTTTFGEDSNGRYATASDLPAHVRVYVPDRLQGEDAIKYADEKLDLQRQFLASRQKSAPRNSGIPEVSQGANDYNATQNRPPVVASNEPIDAEFGKRTADAYSLMEHNPSDPRVQRSYAAFKQDVKNQWDYATKVLGIQFEPTTEDPYKGGTLSPSQEMEADVRDNHHLSFYTPENLPSAHPLTEVDPETGLTYNQMFRAVHDLFGHAAHGNQFGPTGERNAYLDHAQMFSHAAIPALTAETHGQNSWVNFGNHLRNAEGNIPKKGEPGYIPPKERPFAEQKAGWLPRRFQTQPTLHPDLQVIVDKYGITNRVDKVMQGASFITPDGKFIPLGAITHPEAIETLTGERPEEDKEALGEKLSQNWEPTRDSRVRFLNETGAIRVRASNDRAGKTLHISVPAEGVTPEQLESMRRLVSQQGRYGNVVLERADVTPETADILSRYKEFARPSDVEDMLHEIAAHPETKDTANLMLKKGLPEYQEGGPHLQIPSYLLGPQMGTTESTVGHEYGHVLEAALRNAGKPLDGIMSHLHGTMRNLQALGGVALGANPELTRDVLEYGRKDGLQKLSSNGLPHYRNALDRFLAGGVVEDEYYNVPWETNEGKRNDVEKAIRLLQSAGLDSPKQWAAEIQASHDRIRHDLQIPGMRDIFMKYASSREEGLSPEYHASLNRLENFVNEVKNHYEIQKGPQTLANRGRLPQIGSPTPARETNVGQRRGIGGLAGGGKAGAEPGAGRRNVETAEGEQSLDQVPFPEPEASEESKQLSLNLKNKPNRAGKAALRNLENDSDESVSPFPYPFDAPYGPNSVPSVIFPDGRIVNAENTHLEIAHHAGYGGRKDSLGNFLKDTEGVRVIYPEFGESGIGVELYSKPNDIQKRIIAHNLQRATKNGFGDGKLYWDFVDPKGYVSGQGSVGDFLRAVDKQWPRKEKNTGEQGLTESPETPDLKSNTVAEPEEETSTKWIPAAIDAMKESPAGAIDPHTGKMDKTGFGVEVYPEARAKREPLDHEPTAEDLQKFYDQHKDIFDKHPELRVGWDKTDKGWELNIGASGTEEGARLVGKNLDQRAAWDIAKGEEVPTGGKGEKTKFGQYPLEDRLADLTGENVKKLPIPVKNNPHLTDEEKYLLASEPSALKDFNATRKRIASAQELAATMQMGQANRFWYDRARASFDAMFDSLPEDFHTENDRVKFPALVAATSPQTDPSINVRKALEAYQAWIDAGRPINPTKVRAVTEPVLTVKSTHAPNVSRALTNQPISGPKVTSFARNLSGQAENVTNDMWGAITNGIVDPKELSRPGKYIALSENYRKAADMLGWTPEQGQAASWGFIRTLGYLSGWKGQKWTPPELVVHLVDDPLVRQYSADVADIFLTDDDVRDRLESLGVNLEDFDARLEAGLGKFERGKKEGKAEGVDVKHLTSAVRRVEAGKQFARREAEAGRRVSGKMSPLLNQLIGGQQAREK